MVEIPFNRGAIAPTQCISGGWDLIKSDYWLFLGIALVAGLIVGCIPCLNLFLAGPIMAGVFYVLLTRMTGQYVSFGMMFKGFDKFVPTMIVGLIQAIPGVIFQVVRLTTDIGANIFQAIQHGNERYYAAPNTDVLVAGGLSVIILLLGLVIFVLSIAVYLTFFFVYPLIMEYDLGAWDAIKTSAKAGWSNVGGLILLGLLQGLVALAGMLALCIGIIFVMPILQASNAVAYRQVFPAPSQFTPTTPPSPDSFGADYGKPNYGGQNYGGV
jgi:uncharacterized membrane protein